MARLIQSMIIALSFSVLSSVSALAERAADLERLEEVLRIDDLFEVMGEEGDLYAVDLEEQLFEGKGGERWRQDVRDIYQAARLKDRFWQMFSESLPDEAITDVLAFYDTDLGRKITDSELVARRAFLDPAVEEAAIEIVEDMIRNQDPFLITLREYAEVNELVDSNVVSSMNAQFSFMDGLVQGGAISTQMTENEILDDIMSQEPDIRADTSAWVMSFLALAYRPLTEAEMREHISFGRTGSGRKFNNALFTSFDLVFQDVSRALGLAAATYMKSQEL